MRSKLYLNTQVHSLIPITEFRSQFALPSEFSVNLFEPKDYTGLARLDHAGSALNRLRSHVLTEIPNTLAYPEVLSCLSKLTEVFHRELIAINGAIGLRDSEIDFAVSGFEDVCQAFGYAWIAMFASRRSEPRDPATEGKSSRADSSENGFEHLYEQWWNAGVRVSTQRHHYSHNGNNWQIQILNNVYGRIGLVVYTDTAELDAALDTPTYVYDNSLACPAEQFMYALLKSIYDKVQHGLTTGSR